MGYFSNGTEFDLYEEQYCGRCVHNADCPVLVLHLLHNYEECNNPKSMLHTLMPRGKDGFNEQCRLFHEHDRENAFVVAWDAIAAGVHQTALQKGWWDEGRNDAEMIALMHSELSEALEFMRHGNPPDDKVPEYSGVEVELADVIIRIMGAAQGRGWDIARALVAKLDFNKTREKKHGKQF